MRNPRMNSSTAVRSWAEKLGERAVTDKDRFPKARWAAQARYAESAPPESATIREGSRARDANNRRSLSSGENEEDSAARIGTNAVMAVLSIAQKGRAPFAEALVYLKSSKTSTVLFLSSGCSQCPTSSYGT